MGRREAVEPWGAASRREMWSVGENKRCFQGADKRGVNSATASLPLTSRLFVIHTLFIAFPLPIPVHLVFSVHNVPPPTSSSAAFSPRPLVFFGHVRPLWWLLQLRMPGFVVCVSSSTLFFIVSSLSAPTSSVTELLCFYFTPFILIVTLSCPSAFPLSVLHFH